MTKFDEISLAYREARKTYRVYQEDCANFARELVAGMLEYMDWPTDQEVTYIAIGEELDPNNRFYALTGAMKMDEHSFWQFGVELKLKEGSGSYPISLVLSFFIKKMGNVYVVKMGANGRELKIPAEKQTELMPFYEAIVLQIKEFFAKKYVLAVSGEQRDFGFIKVMSINEFE
jgi:hypothetical protein